MNNSNQPPWAPTIPSGVNDPLMTSKQSIDALELAAINDARGDRANGGMFHSSEYSVLSMRKMPVSQAQMLAGQKAVIALALSENPVKKLYQALADAKVINDQYNVIVKQVETTMHHQVNAEYQRLVDDASARVLTGDVTALEDLESEKDIGTRFEAERSALQDATRKLGHAQIPHMLVLREEIDKALAKLAKRLETRDAEDCANFGIEMEFSLTTRLVQAVRIQFHRRTSGLSNMEHIHPSAPCSPMVRILFSDFLDLTSWE